MPETTEQQETTPETPVTPPVVPPAQPAKISEDWEARYKGTSTVINRLNAETAEWKTKYEQALADAEQLRSQVNLKDVEKTVAVGERDKQLSELVKAKTELESEITSLRALKRKLDIAKELGRPDLVEVADSIPSIEDPTVLKEIMSGMLKWSDGQVQARERQLLSGVTPPVSSVPPVTQTLPPIEDEAAWRAYVNSTGDPKEKQRRFEEWSKVGHNLK
jgi:hypothetical protein